MVVCVCVCGLCSCRFVMHFTTHHAHRLLCPSWGSLLVGYIRIFVIRTSFQLEEYEPEQDLVQSAAVPVCALFIGEKRNFCFYFYFYFPFLTFCFIIFSSFIWGCLPCPDWFSWWIPSNLWRCGWLLAYYPRWKSCWIGWEGGRQLGAATQTTPDWLFQLRDSRERELADRSSCSLSLSLSLYIYIYTASRSRWIDRDSLLSLPLVCGREPRGFWPALIDQHSPPWSN